MFMEGFGNIDLQKNWNVVLKSVRMYLIRIHIQVIKSKKLLETLHLKESIAKQKRKKKKPPNGDQCLCPARV